MSKKSHANPHDQPRLVKVSDKAGDELTVFPTDRHVITGRQREVPNPAAALASLGQPSERARLRAATLRQEQRDSRARREVLAMIEAEDARRDAIAHGLAPTVRDDLQAAKRRPWDAPMATRIGELPDPLAQQSWDAIVADAAETASKWWGKWQFSLALAAWSIGCFLLGRLA